MENKLLKEKLLYMRTLYPQNKVMIRLITEKGIDEYFVSINKPFITKDGQRLIINDKLDLEYCEGENE